MWCGLLIYNLGEITAVLERICLKDHIPFMISFKWSNELFPLIKYKILNERQLAYFYFQVLLCFQFIFQEFFLGGFFKPLFSTTSFSSPSLYMSNNITTSQTGDKAPGWIWIMFIPSLKQIHVFIYVPNFIALKEDDIKEIVRDKRRSLLYQMKMKFIEAVSRAQVPELHWSLNYFLGFAWNMKVSPLEKSFRLFLV